MDQARPDRSSFASFLLAQVGAHAARRFAERLSALQMTPPHAGILRMLAHSPGISQRQLAANLGMHASRLVGVIDEMEALGLVERHDHSDDRRTHSLQLTSKGRERMAEVGRISREHNEAMCASLSPEERTTLTGLLQRIADQEGLVRGVHPGYSRLGGDSNPTTSSRKKI